MARLRTMTNWMLPGILLAAVCAAAQAPAKPAPGPIKSILNKAGEMKTAGAEHAAAVENAQPGTMTTPPAKGAPPAQPPAKGGAAQPPAKSNESAKQMAAHAAALGKGKTDAKQVDSMAARRDPFQNPIRNMGADAMPQQALPPGIAGLLVGQVNLVGVVKTTQGMRAMVTASNNRTYFLKENDKVYNGVVTKITADSLIFEETLLDPLGQTVKREAVKKLPGEK